MQRGVHTRASILLFFSEIRTTRTMHKTSTWRFVKFKKGNDDIVQER